MSEGWDNHGMGQLKLELGKEATDRLKVCPQRLGNEPCFILNIESLLLGN